MAEDGRVGDKLTALRESLGLSIEEVAERSGCETSVIVELEAGELAPSLAPLIKITRALGCRLGTLLDDDTNVGPVITRADLAQQVKRIKDLETSSEAGVLDFYSMAAGKTSRHMEPFVIVVSPRVYDKEPALSSHEGEEFIFVLEGAIIVQYGQERNRLNAGDSIYYDSVVPHEVTGAGDDGARILAVIYEPV